MDGAVVSVREKLALTEIVAVTFVSVRGFAVELSLQEVNEYSDAGTAVTAVPSDPLFTV